MPTLTLSRPLRGRLVPRVLTLLCSVVVLGCSGDTTGPAPLSPSQACWALQLNYRAVNMDTAAPGNTVQLTATPLSAADAPLSGTHTVHYSARDSNVTVSPTGLVTAHFATLGAPVPVIAALTVQGVTLADTALVQVTDTAPQHALETFSLQPVAGDSAKFTIGDILGQFAPPQLPVYATDGVGDMLRSKDVSALLVAFSASDPTIATIDRATGQITPHHVGHVTLYASTWAYGVVKQDSLQFTIGYPLSLLYNVVSRTPLGSQTPVLAFTPSQITVGVGAFVIFKNQSTTDSIDVVFDDSTAVQGYPGFPGGNLPPLNQAATNWSCSLTCGLGVRLFPVSGTYSYHSRLFGTSGAIIVSAGP